MKHTRAALFAGLTLTATSIGAFVPAHAADTTVTFTLSQGALNVSAQPSAALTAGNVGIESATGSLGEVEVVDDRGLLVGDWEVTIETTDFTSTEGTIDASNVRYASGATAFVGTTGVGLGLPALGLSAPDANNQWSMQAVTVGSSSATWTPSLTVLLDAGTVKGAYTGTITHSVA